MNSKPCPICGSNLTEQRWKAKSSGKDCHAWRHEDKNPQCEDPNTHKPFIEWIPDTPKQAYAPKSANYSPKNTQESASQIVGMRELYTLTKAVGISLLSVQAISPAEAIKMIEENVVMLKNIPKK